MKKLLLALLLSPVIAHSSCKELLTIYQSSIEFQKQNITLEESLEFAFFNFEGNYQTWKVLEFTIAKSYEDIQNKVIDGESKYMKFCEKNIKFKEEKLKGQSQSQFLLSEVNHVLY